MTKHEVRKKYFGYDSFREGQETLVISPLVSLMKHLTDIGGK